MSHALWAAALLGGLLGMLLLLATRRYGFVWETTILPAQSFLDLSAALGVLPAVLGFPVPDAATVLASGDAPMLEESGRRAWAGWLLGAVLVYGVLPRVALALLCGVCWQRSVARLTLDVSQPGYARLRQGLMPDSERIGISDPEPAQLAHPHFHAPLAGSAGAAVAVALELGDDLPWPPVFEPQRDEGGNEGQGAGVAAVCTDGGRLDTREQRREALLHFAQCPPLRLLVVVDARQTPDRGSLGVISDLADRAGALRVWALSADADRGVLRLKQWREGLLRIGLDAGLLIETAPAARAWLAGEPQGGAGDE